MTRKSRTRSASASVPTSTPAPSECSSLALPSLFSFDSPSPSPSSSDPESNIDPLDPEPTPHIPRPPNSFMLFRADWCKKYKDTHKGKRPMQRVHSKSAAAEWKAASPEVKQHYAHLAEQADLAHKQRYPGYKYRPGPPKYKNGVRIASRKPYSSRKKAVAQPRLATSRTRAAADTAVASSGASSGPRCVSLCPVDDLCIGDIPGASEVVDGTRVGPEAGWLEEPYTLGYTADDLYAIPNGDPEVEEMERLYIQFDMPPHDPPCHTT